MFKFNLALQNLRHTGIRPLSLAFTLGLGVLTLQSSTAAAQAMSSPHPLVAMATANPLPRTSGHQLEEGIHFFGEARERDQLGSTYMIFEVKDAKVLGAVYAPHSAYSCFEGRFNDDQLALRVDDPYGDDVFMHEIALEQTAIIAASPELNSVEMGLGLAGMKAIDDIQEQEHNLLASCQAEL